MEAYIFRHGESPYEQGEVSLREADDLTPEGARTVRDSANHLGRRLRLLDQDSPIQIYSSSFGRCLHTAKVIGNALSDSGFSVAEIRENDSLGEVGNFDWDLYHQLAVGGEIEYDGEKFIVDNSLTNPQGLGQTNYFRSDAAHNLSDKAKASLPEKYLERVDSFERYPSVSARLDSKLEDIGRENGVIPIISTHEGLTGKFIEGLTGNKNAFLDRGKYFGVKSEGGIWVPFAPQEDAITSKSS